MKQCTPGFRLLLCVFLSLAVATISCERKSDDKKQPVDEERVESSPEPVPPGTRLAPRWRVLDADELSSTQQAQVERARGAQKGMGKALKQALTQAIEQQGHADAIAVCSEVAPALAKEASAADGIRIGRTSFKLRNPKNTPPEWMEPIVEARSEAPHVVEGPDGVIGVASPLFVDGLCLDCHGSDEWRKPEVDPLLAEFYPDDQATGFEPGDLRGWFWVEVSAGEAN